MGIIYWNSLRYSRRKWLRFKEEDFENPEKVKKTIKISWKAEKQMVQFQNKHKYLCIESSKRY